MRTVFQVFTVALLVMLVLVSCNDDPASPEPEPRWEITLGGAGDDMPRDVARFGEQVVVVGSWEDEGSAVNHAYAAVIDADGSLLRDTILLGDSNSTFNCILPLSENNFVVAGQYGHQAMVMFLDMSFAVDSMYLYESPDEYTSREINGIIQSRSGGYLLAGSQRYSRRPIPPSYSSWLAYAEGGDSLMRSQLLPGNAIYSVRSTWNGTAAFTWSNSAQTWYCDPGQPCDVSDICFGVCDENGDTTWLKTIPGPTAEYAAGVYTDPSVIMVSGTNGSDIWFGSYDHDGNELATKVLVDTTGVTCANDIAPGPSSSYILCGKLREYDWSDTDALLIKLDHQAEVIWQKRLGGDQYDEAIRVLPLAFGYLMLGRTRSQGAGGDDFWLIRTDLDGNTE